MNILDARQEILRLSIETHDLVVIDIVYSSPVSDDNDDRRSIAFDVLAIFRRSLSQLSEKLFRFQALNRLVSV